MDDSGSHRYCTSSEAVICLRETVITLSLLKQPYPQSVHRARPEMHTGDARGMNTRIEQEVDGASTRRVRSHHRDDLGRDRSALMNLAHVRNLDAIRRAHSSRKIVNLCDFWTVEQRSWDSIVAGSLSSISCGVCSGHTLHFEVIPYSSNGGSCPCIYDWNGNITLHETPCFVHKQARIGMA